MPDGDFSFIQCPDTRAAYEDMYTAVTKAAAWDDIRQDPGEGGFMFGARALTAKLMENLTAPHIHSGASAAFYMRQMQFIARYGWAAWQSEFTH